ncbi:MAG: SGNH/GDSL hydrolase family protein [Bacteroidales bacterium]|nr:SGNH/GDSL hydrolase family protein [Bacteroidales bacterium]
MKRYLWFLSMFLSLPFSMNSQTFISPSDPKISYMGRFDFSTPERVSFAFPGSQIQALFEGSTLAIIVKPESGYFMVEIDENEPVKVNTMKPDSIYIIAQSLPKGVHKAVITYCNEGLYMEPEFRGFLIDEKKKLRKKAVLPERKIEFIGNSITCGFGVEAASENEKFSDANSNFFYSYAFLTARKLNAQYIATARSGIGVYRNYDGPLTGNLNCMPNVYERINIEKENQKWDFTQYIPDVVCINLGTNDVSTGDYDYELLCKGYSRLYKMVRGYYPKAKIVFVSSPMLSGKRLNDSKRAMKSVGNEAKKVSDNEIYFFDLTLMDGSLGYGADYHPSKKQHELMADELSEFLKKLMKW